MFIFPELGCYSFPLTLITIVLMLSNALKDFLYSRHTLPYLNCGMVAQFHLGNQDQSPQNCNSLPCLLIQRHEESEVSSEQS